MLDPILNKPLISIGLTARRVDTAPSTASNSAPCPSVPPCSRQACRRPRQANRPASARRSERRVPPSAPAQPVLSLQSELTVPPPPPYQAVPLLESPQQLPPQQHAPPQSLPRGGALEPVRGVKQELHRPTPITQKINQNINHRHNGGIRGRARCLLLLPNRLSLRLELGLFPSLVFSLQITPRDEETRRLRTKP